MDESPTQLFANESIARQVIMRLVAEGIVADSDREWIEALIATGEITESGWLELVTDEPTADSAT